MTCILVVLGEQNWLCEFLWCFEINFEWYIGLPFYKYWSTKANLKNFVPFESERFSLNLLEFCGSASLFQKHLLIYYCMYA